jgi:hypothetical protein
VRGRNFRSSLEDVWTNAGEGVGWAAQISPGSNVAFGFNMICDIIYLFQSYFILFHHLSGCCLVLFPTFASPVIQNLGSQQRWVNRNAFWCSIQINTSK